MEVLDPLDKYLFESAAMAHGSGQAFLLFPQICLMELQLLASSSPDPDVLSHILQSILATVKMHHSNAEIIYQQVKLSLPSNCMTLFWVAGLLNDLCNHIICLEIFLVNSTVIFKKFEPGIISLYSRGYILISFSFFVQGGVKTILTGFANILTQSDSCYKGMYPYSLKAFTVWNSFVLVGQCNPVMKEIIV